MADFLFVQIIIVRVILFNVILCLFLIVSIFLLVEILFWTFLSTRVRLFMSRFIAILIILCFCMKKWQLSVSLIVGVNVFLLLFILIQIFGMICCCIIMIILFASICDTDSRLIMITLYMVFYKLIFVYIAVYYIILRQCLSLFGMNCWSVLLAVRLFRFFFLLGGWFFYY